MLIDVYGGSRAQVLRRKGKKLVKGIECITKVLRDKASGLPAAWKGIVLAPFVAAQEGSGLNVKVISGEAALKLLGGLRQVAFAVDVAPAHGHPAPAAAQEA